MSNYPTVRPSLTLDFQKSKQLDPRISFSRSSSATYVEGGVVKYADEHQARFEKEGLLIEESRTNEFPYSEDFSDVSWTKSNTTVTSNATTAPDGIALTADRLQIGSTNGVIYNNTVGGVASNSTISMWVKAVNPGTDDVFRIASAGDLSGDLTATNEWVRYTFTSSIVPSSLHGIVRPSDNTAADVYVWGAQFEEGKTFPTSYIPTAGSTVTRSTDIAQITGDNFSSWYNTSESTWYAEGDQQSIDVNGNQVGVNSLFVDRYANISTQRWRVDSWRGTQGNTSVVSVFSTPVTPEGNTVKTVFAIDGTNAKMCVEGVLSSTGTLSTYPQTTEMRIGKSARLVVNDDWRGHISRLAYYSERLTDTQLEVITS